MKQSDFTARLARYVQQNQLLRGGERVLLAVSGGADSVLLLREMCFLTERFSLSLYVAHVEHGIRGNESLRDAAFVRELCAQLGVPFALLSVDAPALAREKKCSLEEAARAARYDALQEEAQRSGCTVIATAHHAQDQAETVLLRLLRGTGPEGLGGMVPERPLTSSVRLIRPFLWARPEEIREELEALGQSWQEDSTNADTAYSRNYLRQEILPGLEERFPESITHIADAADDLRKIHSYFLEMVKPLLPTGDDASLDAATVTALPEPARPLLLKEWLRRQGTLKDVGRPHVEALLALAAGPEGGECSLPGKRIAYKAAGRLVLAEGGTAGLDASESEAICPASPAVFCKKRIFTYKKGLQIPETPYTKWMDYATIEKPVFRTRQEGDYFILPGGGRKTVKSFFIDRKIPQRERDRIWLLAQGSHVLWIVGWRMSAAVRITENTRQVWEIRLGDCDERTCGETSD